MSKHARLIETALPEEMRDIITGSIRDEFGRYLAEKESSLSPVVFGELTGSAGKLAVGRDYATANITDQIISYDEIEKMRHDPQITIGCAVKKLPILGLNWDFYSSDEGARQFFKEQFTKIGRKLIQSSLLSMDFGFIPHEVVYGKEDIVVMDKGSASGKVLYKRDGAIVWKKIKPIYPADVTLVLDELNNFVAFEQYAALNYGPRLKSVIRVPASKAFLVTNQEEFGNVYGQSSLIPIYTPWYLKILLEQFMMRFFEKRGTPPLTVTAPVGKSTSKSGQEVDNLDEARKLGESMLENSVAVLPFIPDKKSGNNTWSVAYMQDSGGNGRTDQFLEAINYFNTQILRGLGIPERAITQDSGTGTFSMSQTHADFFLLEEEGILKKLEEDINGQLIQPLLKANFVKDIDIAFKFDTLQFGKKELLKEIYLQVLKGQSDFIKGYGAVPYKVTPDVEKLAKELDLPTKAMELVKIADMGGDIQPLQQAAETAIKNNDNLKGMLHLLMLAGRCNTKEEIDHALNTLRGTPDTKLAITSQTPNMHRESIVGEITTKKSKKKKKLLKIFKDLDDDELDTILSVLKKAKKAKALK